MHLLSNTLMNSNSPHFLFRWITALAVAVGLSSSLFAADPVVSNLTAAQRSGTKLVVTTCDVITLTFELTHTELLLLQLTDT